MLNFNGTLCLTLEELEIQIANLSEEQQQSIRNDFNGIQNEPKQDENPYILSLLLADAKVSDFRAIDHNVMLNQSLSCTEVYGQSATDRGLLLKKLYTTNLGNRVFEINYTYTKNQYGIFTHQQLVLAWYKQDGTLHPLIKDKGHEPLTTKRSKEIVKNRRKTIMAMLENNVEQLLIASGTGNAGLTMGRQLLMELSPSMATFENSGVATGIVDFMQDAANHAKYPFLLADIGGALLVKDYVTNFMDFE